MSLKIKGQVIKKGEVVTFDSGFQKLEFVLKTQEEYPQEVKFDVIKDKALSFNTNIKLNDVIDVDFNIRGNEYNGKHYVNLQAWKFTSSSDNPVQAPQQEEVTDDLPF